MHKYVVALLILIPIMVKGQSLDLGSWNILNVKYNPGDKWSVFGEAQIRSLRFYRNFHYHEYSGGVSFKPHTNLTLTIGAGDYDTYNEGGNFLNPKKNDEFRLWPQISFNQPIGNLIIEHRYRAEFRFSNNGFRNRFRYRLGASFPFGNRKSYFLPYQINISNEIFFTDREPYFERNRAVISTSTKISKQTIFQLGYLHQFDYKINDETGRDFLQVGFYIVLAQKIRGEIKL